MKLDWDRPGVVRATMTVTELAAFVASARMASAALAAQSPEQAAELERVIAGYDRAAAHLGAGPSPATTATDKPQDGLVTAGSRRPYGEGA